VLSECLILQLVRRRELLAVKKSKDDHVPLNDFDGSDKPYPAASTFAGDMTCRLIYLP
jgi:hypothetical protein